jgi:acetyltransferase-like isoleucine patch superfamily enzyme
MEKIKFIFFNPITFIITKFCRPFPFFSFLFQTTHYQNCVDWKFWFKQKILNQGRNKQAYWPVHPSSQVYDVENILVGVDAYPGIMKGCYIQGKGGIEIGDYTQIAPNVVIVSANHDVYDSRNHISAKVIIGKYCWLGAGCQIMPGVTLGDFTIVGAGAVVTKSFPEGYCILGGVPAKKIKNLEKEKCIHYELKPKFNGYIKSSKFEAYRKKHLNV